MSHMSSSQKEVFLMEKKALNKILDYLHVIQTTCDRYGWDGARGAPIEREAIADSRRFFDYLRAHIPLKETPELEDVIGNPNGAITFLWETKIDPVKVSYDTFQIDIMGNDTVTYKAELESLNTKVYGEVPLEPELCQSIMEHIKFFRRLQNEKQQVQKPTAPEPSTDEQVQ